MVRIDRGTYTLLGCLVFRKPFIASSYISHLNEILQILLHFSEDQFRPNYISYQLKNIPLRKYLQDAL